MNITYLFGNGFDVNLGLPTRYTDYYPIYLDIIKYIMNEEISILNPWAKSIREFWQHMREEDKDWADFEQSISLYAKGDETDIKAILSNFTNHFSGYLRNITNSKHCNEECADEFVDFILNGQNNLQRHDKALMEPYKIKSKATNDVINLITFNYTDSLEKILKCCAEKYTDNVIFRRQRHNSSDYIAKIRDDILHIHGTLEDGDSVIIGIDSIGQFVDENLKHNEAVKPYCVKTQINEDIGYTSRENKFKSLISNSDVIFTYGVSFGKTDKTRWDVVADWLRANSNHKLVVYYYDTKLNETPITYARDLLDRIDELKKEIMQKIGIDINTFPTFKNQIFIIDSNTVLKSKFTDKNTILTATT